MDGEHDDGRLLEDCQMGVLVDARSTVLTKRRSNTQYMYLFTCTCVMSFSRAEKCRSKNNNKPGGSGAEVGWRMHPRRYNVWWTARAFASHQDSRRSGFWSFARTSESVSTLSGTFKSLLSPTF